MKHLFTLLLIIHLMTSNLQAQISGSDAVVQTHFMAIGINEIGYHYIDSIPNDIYHRPELGFIADFGMDGWDVGTPASTGDIIVPGTPLEEWALYADSDYVTITDTWDTAVYSTINDTTRAQIGCDLLTSNGTTLTYTQTTIAYKFDLFFIDEIELINTGSNTIHDIYYTRNIDPDIETYFTGDFTALLSIDTTHPECANAYGLEYDTYFGLGSAELNMHPTIGGFFIDQILPDLYTGAGEYELSGTLIGDYSLQNTFYFDSLSVGDTLTFRLAYIFSESQIDAAMMATAGIDTTYTCAESLFFEFDDASMTSLSFNLEPLDNTFYYAVATNLDDVTVDTTYLFPPTYTVYGLDTCTEYLIEVLKICNGITESMGALVEGTDCPVFITDTEATFYIFPNPATNTIAVGLPENIELLSIYSMDGQLVYQLENPSATSVQIPIADWSPGTYFIACNNYHTTFIKQ